MVCIRCHREMETEALEAACAHCGGSVVLAADRNPQVTKHQLEERPAGVWRYSEFLPRVEEAHVVSLGEGGTPVLRAERLGRELGLKGLLIKDESRNPTGSFMDRGSTVLLSLAKRKGVRECFCTTTGNLGASLAAYCAKAGTKARVRIPPEVDRGKLYQMLAYGAEVDATSKKAPPRSPPGVLTVNAGNPYLMEGEKTTGLELIQQLEWDPPDAIVVPVGTGGHLSMIWRAITQLREMGFVDGSECMLIGVQIAESSGVPRPGVKSPERQEPLLLPELEESVPFFREEADRAIKMSGGMELTVGAGSTVAATSMLARTEGIFAEPSSASVITALSEAVRRGAIGPSERVVCIVTGAGLKDPRSVSRLARETRRVAPGESYALVTPTIGETKFAVLRFLRDGPTYGYALWRRLGVERRMSTASVYQHLSELEDFGMVAKRGMNLAKGRERILYGLTQRGNDFLRIAGRLETADRKRNAPAG